MNGLSRFVNPITPPPATLTFALHAARRANSAGTRCAAALTDDGAAVGAFANGRAGTLGTAGGSFRRRPMPPQDSAGVPRSTRKYPLSTAEETL
jgi:hypothetical protein